MLEILFIILLLKRLKTNVQAKNQRQWLPWMVPLLWFGGQFSGAFLAGLIHVVLGKDVENTLAIYGWALLGGGMGAAIAFLIVKLMPIKPLFCPACDSAFTKRSKWGVECEQCHAQLKITDNKVSLVEHAAVAEAG